MKGKSKPWCMLICTVILFTLASIVRAESQSVNAASKPAVDSDGTVHIPAFDMPLSSYMSEEAKAAFIRQAQVVASAKWDGNIPISKLRELTETWSQPLLQRARALYEVEIKEQTVAGVRTYMVTPKKGVPTYNQERVLISLHGGGFFMGAGPSGVLEAVPIAAVSKMRVISIDYRMGPEYQFPAASEDVAAVYKELLKHYPAKNVGIYGSSAGGILTAMSLAWFQREKLETPGAVGMISAGAFGGGGWGDPHAPGSWVGDSRFTAPPLTGLMPLPRSGELARLSKHAIYLDNIDASDPMVSPARSPEVLAKFPPTLLVTGTRAWDMSAAIQTHRQLIKAGVEADLHVWDGMGHGFYVDVDLPESKEAYDVIARFFEAHLGTESQHTLSEQRHPE